MIFYVQVKLLLQPPNILKFHQNLHLFRVKELPKILSEQDHHRLLPSTCCYDLIMWQCIVDHIVKMELLSLSKESQTRSINDRRLSLVEENAIRYTAGFVIKKLLDKFQGDNEVTMCLNSMLKDGAHDVIEHFSEVYLRETDRGFLKHLTDTAYEFFVELEMVTYNYLQSISLGVKDFNMKNLHSIVSSDVDVLRIWALCAIDIETTDKQLSILLDITKEWTKLRGHSIASMELEKHKRKKLDTTRKKSLRRELRRLGDK